MNDNKGLVFFGVGFELMALCVSGHVVGGYIDQFYGWTNQASTYLVLVLMVGWFIHLVYLLRRFAEEEDDGPGPSA